MYTPEVLVNSTAYVAPGMIIKKLELIHVACILMTECNTDLQKLRSKSRIREIVALRQKISYLLHWYGFGLSEIARLFYQDHCSIIHSCNVVENDMLTNKELKEFVRRMQHTKLRKE